MTVLRLVVFSLLLAPVVASAQLNRAFVSTAGSDANPCTSGAPCRSFGAALAQTNSGGEILAVDSGGYGPVTINKTVSIVAAPGAHAAITATVGAAVAVTVGSGESVLIRGLSLIGAGADFGVDFSQGSSLLVEDCSMSGFTFEAMVLYRAAASSPAALIVRGSTLRDNGAGFYIHSTQPTSLLDLVLTDTIVTTNGQGIEILDNVSATLDRVQVAMNGTGINMNSSNLAPSNVTVHGSTAAHNTGSGIASIGNGGVLRISDTTVLGNATGVEVGFSATVESYGNNRIRGNNLNVSGTITTISPN